MTLEELRLKLVSAATGMPADQRIEQVVFDYNSYMNGTGKTYPLALWDLDNLEGQRNVTSGERTLTMNCWCINLTTPEADVVYRHRIWDEIETVFGAYITAVNALAELSVLNIRNIPIEYFPAGLLSLEREMAVRYRVELQLWC